MTEEEKAKQTKAMLRRVLSTDDGKSLIDHLQKIFLPAPSMWHQGTSEQCLLGRAEVIIYLTRNSGILN